MGKIVIVILFATALGFLIFSTAALTGFSIYNPAPNEGFVSFTFDDGYENQYALAYPAMKLYGFNGTLYLIANQKPSFEKRATISFEQARIMQSDGWEIGSHSVNHKNFINFSYNEVKSELEFSKEILENKGFKIDSISYPFGYFNSGMTNVAKKYYSSGRGMWSGYNDFSRLDRYNLRAVNVKLDTSPEEICSMIYKAKEDKSWLIVNFHYIESKEERTWDESLDDFNKILACADNSRINVKTVREIIAIAS